MNLLLNNYIDDKTVLINKPSTYPKKWLEFLNQNKKLLRNYRYIETFNFNNHEKAKVEGRDCSRIHETNKYNDAYYKTIDDFAKLIYTSNVEFICFHATRLTNEEIIRIKQQGLRTFDSSSIYECKYKPLYQEGYITNEELKILRKVNLLNDQTDRGMRTYLRVGYNILKVSPQNDTGNYDLYKNYGGEITFGRLENSNLGIKLNKISKPCSIILKIKCNYDGCYDIARKIIYCYGNNKINYCSVTLISKEETLPVLDILEVDSKSRLIFKKRI